MNFQAQMILKPGALLTLYHRGMSVSSLSFRPPPLPMPDNYHPVSVIFLPFQPPTRELPGNQTPSFPPFRLSLATAADLHGNITSRSKSFPIKFFRLLFCFHVSHLLVSFSTFWDFCAPPKPVSSGGSSPVYFLVNLPLCGYPRMVNNHKF